MATNSTRTQPAAVDGAMLHARLAAAARDQGIGLKTIAQRIVPNGTSNWLKALLISKRPTAETVARVDAAIANEPIPPSIKTKYQPPRQVERPAPVATPEPKEDEEEIGVAALNFVDREPCPWCNVRADIGCKHSRRIAQIATLAPRGIYVAF